MPGTHDMTRAGFKCAASASLVILSIGLSSLSDPAAADQAGNTPRRAGRLIFNLDYSAVFIQGCVKQYGPDLPRRMADFVESLGRTGVTDFFINVNTQRTNYRSDVWESWWDGYDSEGGDDQPFFEGIAPERAFERGWARDVMSLHLQGYDYGQHLIVNARRHGMAPWISLRMNDSHRPNNPRHPYHSTFWKEHPEWRLQDKALDYAMPEVRDHYMALVQEVCQRYDMDGLELDFMRFPNYFRPGQEHRGKQLITVFVRQTRKLTRQAAARRGHEVKLAVRVPSRPWIAQRKGMDAIAWAREGLVDLIIASPWVSSSQNDLPVETWKGLLRGTGTEVAVCLESDISSGTGGNDGDRPIRGEEARRAAISALPRGADAFYLFNYFGSPCKDWERKVYAQFLDDAGSLDAPQTRSRRHALTIIEPWVQGEPEPHRPLPYEGTRGDFRIYIGPRPVADRKAYVEVEVAVGGRPSEVRLNDSVCPWAGREGERLLYEVPAEALSEGHNLVTVKADKEMTITWLEIAVR